MPPKSSFRRNTKCRGRAWHRLLQQLPQMKALFSTTKPYITHTGPASLARSCLICHSRTYVCSPSSEQEDHILQLILQNSKTRLSTLSARYSFTSHTVDPSLVSIRCRILVCCSCCSLGRPGTFFSRQLRHRLSDIAFPGPLKGFSPLHHAALCWNLSLGIYPCLLCIHDISQQCGYYEGRTLLSPVSSAHTELSRLRVTKLNSHSEAVTCHTWGLDPVLLQAVRLLV